MKKAFVILLTLAAFACQNPEDGASTPVTDTIPNTTPDYKEEQTMNTPPGATTPDTSSAQRRTNSKVDTSANH